MSHPENKADLAKFLSRQLILQAPDDKTVVVSGGFSNPTQVESSKPDVDTTPLEASHEGGDTRVVLHCVNSDATSLVVSSQDTDVTVLILAHFDKMKCKKVWMKTGHSKA
jgi:hypothetical protein